jgi:hypothetical protein
MASIAAVVVAASAVVGQTQLSNYEHLKDYGEAVVGKWKAEWESDLTFPGLVEKGDKILVELSSQWAVHRNAISTQWKASVNGVPVATGQGMIGCDKSAERIVGFGFNSFGGRAQSIIEKRGDAWYESISGVGPDARVGASMNIMTIVDKNTHEHLGIGRLSPEGKPLPNMKITYKRAK